MAFLDDYISEDPMSDPLVTAISGLNRFNIFPRGSFENRLRWASYQF